ncbi:ABC-F family ATP-binding cassette domain-containing protein [Schlesneria sp. T3-172]|uniref:ABC-F family ATP-binding cassette domain-containing protein n=1 Tax=Schlesneria sphaerica TaxID=3373610 RepID=UPI0037C50AA8
MAFTVSLSHLSWSVPDGPQLFDDLCLNFGNRKAGIVGRNGVGKTTLLRLIAGEIAPAAGTVFVSGPLGVLRQSVQVPSEMTVADLFGVTAALELLRRAEQGKISETELAEADWTLETRIAAALGRVGLSFEPGVQLAEISGGELTRVRLAALLFDEPAFLLLDEPTNNLDRPGRRAVTEVLAGWTRGAIVVSHDRELLDTMDEIVELTKLGAKRYGGNWSTYRELKAVELAAAQRELDDAEQKIDQIERNAQLTAQRHARVSSRGKKKKADGGTPHIILGMMKDRSENTAGENARLAARRREEAQAAASAAREAIEVLQPLTVSLASTHLSGQKSVIQVQDVTFGYHPDRPVLSHFSLHMRGPERVAITGCNGSGKSTLLGLITGQLKPWHGVVESFVPFVVMDQTVSCLNASKSIRENYLELNPASNEQACRAALARFMFRADAALQAVSTLSGGQLLRAGLACVLGGETPPPLLILDEPTNHLDIDSIEAIETGLRAYDGALLVISHDETFLERIRIDRRVTLGT